ncbi:helix-turn-helix domain-containing protein [Bailinhaonella thermotolerans]|uniref:XRE family transcriptional regulator n=1 Tax=Bailinhaonella thermotolerans TaxID=1070861 RepID=A0A3A3ZZC4_9ACTN|nr:helix-turn-helix transcriptional regulator [Bailinhaonella thermotolerans]RJL20544.1 XRE family transcriptional regulator [Bailinhaonella thermotolerans]
MTADAPGTGSTVRRILLGSHLRRLREAAGITRDAAGFYIRASESKISRLELGRVSFKERDVADLLTLYGVTAEGEREMLLSMAREANAPGWWHKYSDVLPNWFQTYVGLEEAASLIRTYEVQFVPGLLQTEAYARAVVSLGQKEASAREIERRVALRLMRQERLKGEGAPRLWAVIDEAALRRPIGGPEVMREQIEHLITISKLPNLTLQVMPFKFGGHSAEGGAFSILRFPDTDLPDVVYVEQLWGAVYLDKREDVDPYLAAMERLCVESPTPQSTAEILGEILREI